MDARTLGEVMGWTLSQARYEELLPAYRRFMQAAQINNVNRAAMAAAQLGHESEGLKWQAEIWGPTPAQRTYDGRMGNRPGTTDWSDFRGHGWVQITGRENHTNCSRWAYEEGLIDDPLLFVNHPERLGWDEYVWIGPAWYWTQARDLNPLADAGDVREVTRQINGGYNGLADRQARYARALAMGERLLDTEVPPARRRPHEYLMDYSREHVTQLTPWNCGPASTETAILAATGSHVHETQLAEELGTHRGGTDWIGQFPAVLNRHIPGANYTHTEMPSDPPTAEQKERLWDHIVRSWRAGHPVIANIVAPPSNYPRSVAPSTIDLNYSGGEIYHYVAIMGFAGEGASRRVWWADSGFAPFGAWISFDQTATLIPPKGYAWSDAEPKQELIQEEEEITVDQADRIIRHVTDFIKGYIGPIGSDVKDVRQQITGGRDAGEYPGWPQLGKDLQGRNLTLVDGVAAARQDNADLAQRLAALEERFRAAEERLRRIEEGRE